MRVLLSAASDVQVIGRAADWQQAEESLGEADVVLSDDMALLTTVLSVADGLRPAAVALARDVQQVVGWMQRLGVDRWAALPPDASAEMLIAAIRAVVTGLVVLPAEHAHLVRGTPALEGAAVALSPREREVLQLVSQGLPSKLIAQQLGIAEATVKFHLSSVYAKLGVASRAEAISRAAKLGLVAL